MTSPAQALFSAITEQHGGLDRMTPVQVEIVSAMVRVLLELPSAQPAELPRLSRAVAELTAQLPPPPAQPEPDWSKFNDEQLHCIERALTMIKGEPDPGPQDGPEAKTPVVEKFAALIEVAHLKEKVANLEAQLDALLKLNALLEQRLAEEVPA
jgi:hypothetical protein